MAGVTPIEYKSLNQLVYQRLQTEILDGKLPPGTRIKQEELTKRLGVSRTPVREALQRLETEGLVQFARRGPAVVSTISRKRIEEIFELRALLEGYAAEKAAEKLDEKAMKKLRKLIQEMNAHHSRQEAERLLAKNDEFHRYICAQAGNKALLEMLEQIWRDIRRLRFNYLITPAGHETSTREHESLVDALGSHDKELIRKIVQKHAKRTMEGILETLHPHPEAS
jgi:DNA-binding GntR family transcriptional regulator